MPIATLLLRENTSTSLTAIVEKSQHRRPPLPEYDLQLNSCQLDLVLVSQPDRAPKSTSSDEGFESDIDSLSIVSSDDSFTTNAPENASKTTAETDSANGSACSDSDDADAASTKRMTPDAPAAPPTSESHNLVSCICYADVNFPDLLVFVIKQEALVFKFADLENLHKFYTNFSTLKAVTNQKAYGRNLGAKFNLLHRTDNNGVTHIEIAREAQNRLVLPDAYEPTSIISLNTPDSYIDERILNEMKVKVNSNGLKESRAKIFETGTVRLNTKKSRGLDKKSSSIEDMLEGGDGPAEGRPAKTWSSTDNLLEAPKKPERRKKLKGKAPAPPVDQPQNVLKGEYIRVAVPKFDVATLSKTGTLQSSAKSFAMLGASRPKLTTYQQFKYSEPKRITESATLTRSKVNLDSWTSSVPRLLKAQRSRSETRGFTPMAYRYIDTTQTYSGSPTYARQYAPNFAAPNSQISNRLFGMSSKLKDFSSVQNAGKFESVDVKNDGRWSSLGELSHRINNTDNSLKSVIKKDESKRKNEKKVTFSAYTTVQVV